jgi:hypothetical protein
MKQELILMTPQDLLQLIKDAVRDDEKLSKPILNSICEDPLLTISQVAIYFQPGVIF